MEEKHFCVLCAKTILKRTRLVQVRDSKGVYLSTCVDCWRTSDYWKRLEAKGFKAGDMHS